MEQFFEKLVRDFEQGKLSRRQLIQNLMLTATATAVGSVPAAAASTSVKAVSVHHVTWDVKDHMKVSAFYQDVLGMKLFQGTNKREIHARVGDTYLTFRGPGARNNPVASTPRVEHIAIAVEPWPGSEQDDVRGNPKLVAELKNLGYTLPDKGEVRVNDPEGFPVQICGKNWATEN